MSTRLTTRGRRLSQFVTDLLILVPTLVALLIFAVVVAAYITAGSR